jgi:hypothetical protein
MSLAQTLTEEFKRVAGAEDIKLEDLTQEVASATNYTTRQIYNFRTGKWPLPSELIPYFCMRFKSRTLLNSLIAICDRAPVDVPETYDIAKLSLDAVRSTLKHYDNFLQAFDDRKITKQEFEALNESADKVVTMVTTFQSIARQAYESQHPEEELPQFTFAERGRASR